MDGGKAVKRVLLFGLATCSLLVSTGAHADISGATLMQQCEASEFASRRQADLSWPQITDSSRCLSYLAGFNAATDVLFLVTGARMYCVPPSATVGQMALIVLKHMRATPEDLHRAASQSVSLALMVAFPCSK